MRIDMRQRIVQCAVRLLAEGDEVDYFSAKVKAAKIENYRGQKSLPSQSEVQEALQDYQALFPVKGRFEAVKTKRKEALSIMRFFVRFESRLVGNVLNGTATTNTPIQIYLYTDDIKSLILFLLDANIPNEQGERRVSQGRKVTKEIPVIYFSAAGQDVELSIFCSKDLRVDHESSAPELSERRASIKKLEKLIADES